MKREAVNVSHLGCFVLLICSDEGTLPEVLTVSLSTDTMGDSNIFLFLFHVHQNVSMEIMQSGCRR